MRNKNLATRFRILVEIANSGPNIQQQDIAKKLNVTPQAISDYIRQLVDEGLLISEGRSKYRLTSEGVNWVIKTLRELREYDTLVEQAITNISVCAAIAADDLAMGQAVGLRMKDGLLFATADVGRGARGKATSVARAGEDVSVSSIEGVVQMAIGRVTILKIPGIQKGGSGMVSLERVRKEVREGKPVGAIGIEAIVALSNLGIENVYVYGVTEATIEAARSGLSPVIACIDDAIPGLTQRLGEADIDYEIVDMKKD